MLQQIADDGALAAPPIGVRRVVEHQPVGFASGDGRSQLASARLVPRPWGLRNRLGQRRFETQRSTVAVERHLRQALGVVGMITVRLCVLAFQAMRADYPKGVTTANHRKSRCPMSLHSSCKLCMLSLPWGCGRGALSGGCHRVGPSWSGKQDMMLYMPPDIGRRRTAAACRSSECGGLAAMSDDRCLALSRRPEVGNFLCRQCRLMPGCRRTSCDSCRWPPDRQRSVRRRI